MTTIKLWYSNFTRATRPRWLLEELGVPYELVRVDLKAKEHKTPEYVANVHPHGAVPAADVDGKHIIESAAIVATIADRFLDKGLAPKPDAPERAAYFQWLFYAPATLEPALVAALDANATPEAKARYEEVMRFVEKGLDRNDWILGQRFTAADCVIGSLLIWANSAKLLEGFPKAQAYVERCKARPAYQRVRKD